ncbi:TIGR03862 family flavoprotein [Oleomonas cavernae]|uniref:TIGR03862 family flavoprotein n=1 Tax=Oleomonas cavernae TaxID=2320859 RepID=A0A418WB27_9PROT|nr:TIGR03862 family flavoprotein [Oleomonas cavernae]RJF87251.1 TIGR03862 family flavoprotein [Oleomonas cavernae]
MIGALPPHTAPHAVVIGGGPAGLMAAETILDAGYPVTLYDAMPSLGRKFLMAGKSGLNITHGEPIDRLLDRYGPARARLEAAIRAFGPAQIEAFAHDLGIETFTGTSGRIFPVGFKAAPLLRGWLHRLRAKGLLVKVRHRWTGWAEDGRLCFAAPAGPVAVQASAVLLALGGASWAKLGSDGRWAAAVTDRGVATTPFAAANCGFDTRWSEHFSGRFAGQPVKPVALTFQGQRLRGEFVVTAGGVEGGAIYALAAGLRQALDAGRPAVVDLDLLPERPAEAVAAALSRPQGRHSLANHLRRTLSIEGVRAGLVWELSTAEDRQDMGRLARRLKALPLCLTAPRPIDEAISTAGGISLEALDERWMLRAMPGTFCAGEMIDWDAPTGGYLLTACFATGRAAGQGVATWLAESR